MSNDVSLPPATLLPKRYFSLSEVFVMHMHASKNLLRKPVKCSHGTEIRFLQVLIGFLLTLCLVYKKPVFSVGIIFLGIGF